jgi:Cd2+/Zn2+-exporting ATPase
MTTTTKFLVPAMDCPTEKGIIENKLGRMNEVEGLDFDLLDRIVTVRHAAGAEQRVEAALRDVGMEPRPVVDTPAAAVPDACCSAGPPVAAEEVERPTLADAAAWTRGAWLLALAVLCAGAAEILAWSGWSESSWPVIALACVSLLASGPVTFRKALTAVRTFTLNINLLMTIAVIGAIAIGQWPEAAMVTVLFAIAELIESRSVDRARDAIRALMSLAPETAHVRRDGAWLDQHVHAVRIGDIVQVRPGERIPLDGRVTAGQTAVDQAPITGESVPVDRGPGDTVFAGTINQHGAIEIEVTADAGNSTLAHIGKAIRDAQSQKAPTERFVDQFARWYTPAVVLLAISVALVPPLVQSSAFLPWIYKALVLLVIACPCALVISTPVTVVSGLAAAARRGLLVKGGAHLESAHRIRVVALDKTGTLTEGQPRITDVVPLGDSSVAELHQLAASLEATSNHPLARAVVRGYDGTLLPAMDVRAIEGKGLEGTVGGSLLVIGSHRLAEERGVCSPAIEEVLGRLERDGKSVMLVWRTSGVLGVLAVADTLRATSIEAVQRLHARGIRLAMLTGDNATTAAAVAAPARIDDVRANLLPTDKLTAVDELAAKYGPVAMVGDGVNDAPALARASLGIAMGAAGSDTALETADVALMGDDLRGVPELFALSRAVSTTLKVNITLSITIKVAFFALAFAGVATLWMAVFADMGASLLVAANGLRLLRFHR